MSRVHSAVLCLPFAPRITFAVIFIAVVVVFAFVFVVVASVEIVVIFIVVVIFAVDVIGIRGTPPPPASQSIVPGRVDRAALVLTLLF